MGLWLAWPQAHEPQGKEDWKFQVWKAKGMSGYEPGQHEAERGKNPRRAGPGVPTAQGPLPSETCFFFFPSLLSSGVLHCSKLDAPT